MVDGIPIMLVEERIDERLKHTLFELIRSHKSDRDESPLHPDAVDPFVQNSLDEICGAMYKSLVGKLPRYPIPELRLPPGDGAIFLDIGCNWGRWSISAARAGYNVIGIDLGINSIAAARRVARQLGVSTHYLVADARHLPFSEHTFDVAFSYYVLHHLDKHDVKRCLSEIARTLKTTGFCMLQMLNAFALRSFITRIRRGFKEPERFAFEPRFWSPSELIETFTRLIGPTSFYAEGFLSANAQRADKDLLPVQYRLLITLSDQLRRMSRRVRWAKYFAYSLYVIATRGQKSALDVYTEFMFG